MFRPSFWEYCWQNCGSMPTTSNKGVGRMDGYLMRCSYSVGVVFVTLALVIPSSVIESPTGQILYEDGVLSPIFCALIWALSDRTTVISRLLSTKWPVLLGEASYGLYLIHDPVLHLVSPILVHALRNASWREFRVLYILSFPVYLALCIALSIASYLWFEGPARRWIRSRFGSKPKAQIGAGTLTTANSSF